MQSHSELKALALERVVEEVEHLRINTSATARARLTELCESHGEDLASAFYDSMMADPEANRLLSHEVVNSRLRASLQRWLKVLLVDWDSVRPSDMLAMQRHVGQVHARSHVGHHLVLRGIRMLKREMAGYLFGDSIPGVTEFEAMTVAGSLFDIAMEIMTAEYVNSSERAARTDEAYRSHVSAANMALERERQRSALLNWETRLLHSMLEAAPNDRLQTLGESAFGLWIQHKATSIFPSSMELQPVIESIEHIDSTLLPLCGGALGTAGSEQMRKMVREVTQEVDHIRDLMGNLFEHLVDMESGRDALTQLLNRRYLAGITSREIEYSRRTGKQFAALLIDLDHFKKVNDNFGHQTGDSVLQQVAALLTNSVRAGDFVFRYGGEELMILAVEVDRASTQQMAQTLCDRVQDHTFLAAEGKAVRVTVSIGVAMYDGHPDYQNLIERADKALYAAKQAGRNCVVQAS